jgi:hypothetical protein
LLLAAILIRRVPLLFGDTTSEAAPEVATAVAD